MDSLSDKRHLPNGGNGLQFTGGHRIDYRILSIKRGEIRYVKLDPKKINEARAQREKTNKLLGY